MIDRVLNGKYRIISKIGSGGMADVYKGVDLTDNRAVAIKVLKQEYSNDPQYLRRLSREARAMVSLKNEHVVSLLDMGSEEDIHYLVLEYVNGLTLREYMDEHGSMKPHEAVDIVCDVLDGLSHAHKKDLIHRDVKPQNILITEDGVIKLTDFGIAKFAGNSTKTFDGKEAVGSVYYISPEQAKGEEVDARTDLYSVGVLLYEMLTGAPPFTGDNAVQVALKHVNEEIKPLREVSNRFSPALSDVVSRATAKELDVRYPDADSMILDLQHALKNPHSRFARIDRQQHYQARPAEDDKPKNKFLKEHLPLILIMICVLGVIAIFVSMYFISQGTFGRGDYSKVPNLLGQKLEAARTHAENRGFTLVVDGYEASDEYAVGEVCSQDNDHQNKEIHVMISTGMETVPIPDLYGKPFEEAKQIIEGLGLFIDPDIEYQTSTLPNGTVVNQLPPAGQTLLVGDTVKITVSMPPSSETQVMPNLVDRQIDEAVRLLAGMDFDNYRIQVQNSGEAMGVPDLTVIAQSQPAGLPMDLIEGTVLLTVYVANGDNYKAEFSENVSLSADNNQVVVTILTDLGEVIVFTGEYVAGDYTIPFTGRYWEPGTYECRIYVNGEMITSFVRNFE